LLEELGKTIPRTHDLEQLLDLLVPHDPHLKLLRRGLQFLNGYAVDVRYPEKHATKRQAEAATRWAEQLRTESRGLLGIRPPRKKTK